MAPASSAGWIYLVVLVFAVWTGLALQIKRWHDRDKSWVLDRSSASSR